jgi:predicted lactoylglutathione lyase
MKKHDELSYSSAHRWISCPGSVSAIRGINHKETNTVYSNEGSACHYVAYEILSRLSKNNSDESFTTANQWVGTTIEEFGVSITPEMAENIQTYVNYVQYLGGEQLYEVRMGFMYGGVIRYGTCDCVVKNKKSLYIVDLKMGAGIKVFAKDNEQLMMYALAALSRDALIEGNIPTGIHQIYKKIKLVIIQPTLSHFDEYTITIRELRTFYRKMKIAAKAALKSNAQRVPSEIACKWCPAKPTCYALNDLTKELTLIPIDKDISDPIRDPKDLTPHQIKSVLENKRLIINWLNSVEDYVTDTLKAGHAVDGYTLIEGRGTSKIKDISSFLERCKEKGVMADKVLKPLELKCITDLTKIIGPSNFKNNFSDLIVKTPGKPKLITTRGYMSEITDDFE